MQLTQFAGLRRRAESAVHRGLSDESAPDIEAVPA
jgi:hypothetical protein